MSHKKEQYEAYAKNNPKEYENWIEFIPALGMTQCTARPDFEDTWKYFERKEAKYEVKTEDSQ